MYSVWLGIWRMRPSNIRKMTILNFKSSKIVFWLYYKNKRKSPVSTARVLQLCAWKFTLL